MRSLRLSLTVYFLALSAAALGTASNAGHNATTAIPAATTHRPPALRAPPDAHTGIPAPARGLPARRLRPVIPARRRGRPAHTRKHLEPIILEPLPGLTGRAFMICRAPAALLSTVTQFRVSTSTPGGQPPPHPLGQVTTPTATARLAPLNTALQVADPIRY